MASNAGEEGPRLIKVRGSPELIKSSMGVEVAFREVQPKHLIEQLFVNSSRLHEASDIALLGATPVLVNIVAQCPTWMKLSVARLDVLD